MKHRLKILRIITSLNPKFGGTTRGVIESTKQLVKEGFEVDIVTCDPKKIRSAELKNIKIKLDPSKRLKMKINVHKPLSFLSTIRDPHFRKMGIKIFAILLAK